MSEDGKQKGQSKDGKQKGQSEDGKQEGQIESVHDKENEKEKDTLCLDVSL